MPAPIHSELAEEIGVAPDKAEKLLGAMLKEIHKRARQEGVRLPNLGKFSETNGELSFEPSESLARAVNHRFEGLASENLASAPNTEEEEEEDDEGPSTITLGYQDSSNWSPIDSSDEDDTASDDEEPDTEEFQVPSADEAADTQELKASAAHGTTAESDRASSMDSASPSESTSDDDELEPLVEDAPDDEPEPMSASHSSNDTNGEKDEHDSLSDIWETEEDDSDAQQSSESESSPSFSSFEQSDEDEFSDIGDQDEPSFKERFEQRAKDREHRQREPAPPEATTQDDSGGSSFSLVLLIILVVGGATWYVLGQQGALPTPRATFAELNAQIQPHVQNLPLIGSDSGTDSESNATAEGEAPSGDATSQSAGVETGESSPEDGSNSRAINPSQGGWTIVVASRTEFDAAQNLRDKFRQQFADRQLPVDMVEGNVNNTTRYRVGVGQFDSRQKAEQFMENADANLPTGAWLLQLQ